MQNDLLDLYALELRHERVREFVAEDREEQKQRRRDADRPRRSRVERRNVPEAVVEVFGYEPRREREDDEPAEVDPHGYPENPRDANLPVKNRGQTHKAVNRES